MRLVAGNRFDPFYSISIDPLDCNMTAHTQPLMQMRSLVFRQRRGCAAAVLSLSMLFAPGILFAEEVVLSASKDVQIPFPVSRYVVAAIFGMRMTTWADGKNIQVFVMPDDDPAHGAFCRQVLHIFPHQIRMAWDRLIYSGTGQGPQIVSTAEEMRTRLMKTPGAIGYLSKNMINESVKVLPVE
jgi:hypothetical protein